MGTLWEALKKGNTSSATAAIGNTGLAVVKGVAAAFSGSGAMFASAMHSVADAINQGFVFFGSVLGEKKPTPRFPTGFGRVINLFCMIAVIVVTIMAYETIIEGFHLLKVPAVATHFWLNASILVLAIVVDGYVLIKAMKEIIHEARVDAKGWNIVPLSFRNVGRAAPPTRLVFYEDLVATLGAVLALVAVVLTQFTSFTIFDGIATILIGFLMIGVAFRVGYDNMVGLIGVAAPKEVETRVARIILDDPDVTDINRMRIVQEGRFYHVESYIELRPGLLLSVADDIKFRVRDSLLKDQDISDVTLGILEDNGIIDWEPAPTPDASGREKSR
ncbi:cation diffusion facilitator family transporter [Brevibacillus invocatus]|uniref:Cation diffusion facilitator family transporter n=1 Tax=Brevibacillus invocatus TaxID=173959 RepID=A0A3M8CEZ3_9BACL|nr:cation diffusion facilitator family transporter [Brevibacillus invocatus]MCM3080018.1 cation diffusion facilitator family transporter [Brevibacillus invocatus]MCM3430211.1 cation diffusion facilitator family transporter [Brevibacillus invocatus]RNB74278.1 cation diffusion facilitator family transporter [Brevibacillus invocatus]